MIPEFRQSENNNSASNAECAIPLTDKPAVKKKTNLIESCGAAPVLRIANFFNFQLVKLSSKQNE